MEERTGPSTIVDVARAAGVSVATVSRALRGLDRVSPNTREKVRRVAEELHYVASPTATSLASGRTRIVGVVVPFVSRWYFAAMVSAIGKSLRERGYQVLLFDLEQEVFDRRLALTRSMLWKRVDGVISINIPMTETELELLSGLHVPVVSVGYQLTGRSSAGIDDAAAARAAVEHVLALGHREIAYVGAVTDVAALVETPRSRLAAALETMTAHGAPVREEWVLRTDWTAENSRDRARELLAPGRPTPTAVVCGSDEIAFGVHMAARERDLRIPRDVSIIGIDDHPLAGLFSLTTVRQDIMEQGETSVSLLMDELTVESAGRLGRRRVTLETELVLRRSTAPPG
jgi:LacI family transcriptional regulator, repressor for deo operon, udp, cdd, tsx, nupC, and nupG